MSCESYRSSTPRFGGKPVTYVHDDEGVKEAWRSVPGGIIIDLREYPDGEAPSLYADVFFSMGTPDGGLPCFCTRFNDRPIRPAQVASISAEDVMRFAFLGAAVIFATKGVIDVKPDAYGSYPVESVLPLDVQAVIKGFIGKALEG